MFQINSCMHQGLNIFSPVFLSEVHYSPDGAHFLTITNETPKPDFWYILLT